jgi:Protein of unknown function (DUF3467)
VPEVDAEKLVVGLPDLTDAGRPVYANVAHVSWTPYDFRITFSLLVTPHDGAAPARPDATFVPRAVAEVVIPAAAVESLTDLLRTELSRFVDRMGAPQPHLAPARSLS